MPTVSQVAGVVAGIVTVSAYVPYLVSVLRKQSRPNRASWFIWGSVNLVIASSYFAAGARMTVIVPACYGIFSSIIALLSLKHGEGGWKPLDRSCIGGAIVAAELWWWLDSPLVALFMTMAIDFIAALPTMRKAHEDPASEDRLAWALFLLGSTMNIVAIEEWVFKIAIYPIVTWIQIGLIVWFIFRPRRAITHPL